ncbi:MAG: hypothetical protein SH868_11075 [Bythopirellula sp.]|nr:hypothetical protein [Bythopirellula sp.]
MIRQILPNDEIEQRGEELYTSKIRTLVTKQDEGKFVVIDVGTGEYQIDADHVKALEKMLVHHNGNSLYSIRIGSPAAYKLGGNRTE